MKARTRLKMDCVVSKTRSLGQILEKPCVHARDFILNQILVKLGQSVCLDNFLDKYEIKSCWLKNKVKN